MKTYLLPLVALALAGCTAAVQLHPTPVEPPPEASIPDPRYWKQPVNGTSSGRELVRQCERATAYYHGPRRIPFSHEEVMAAGICLGRIDGIASYYDCKPTRLNRLAAAEIFLDYAKRHPSRLTEAYPVVVRDALREAIPCFR